MQRRRVRIEEHERNVSFGKGGFRIGAKIKEVAARTGTLDEGFAKERIRLREVKVVGMGAAEQKRVIAEVFERPVHLVFLFRQHRPEPEEGRVKMIKGVKEGDHPRRKSKQHKGGGKKPFQEAGKDAVFVVSFCHVPS